MRVARNEIYARHGRIFTSPDLAEYFSQKSWYVPSIPADQFDNSYLNSIEIANLQVITQYEADHNLNQ
ncbi:MAG: YARHG domain-containing protein [Lachnospiraceae bacterium]